MSEVGRTLVFLGLGIAALGVVLWLVGKSDFRGLPGDIKFESGNTRVYLPIGSSIALSVLLTLGIWLWRHFQK